ncbi:MAG: hypothetical protein JXQ73_01865 [Phycisphaerae bacterium]|nr:hypothetical protein [Phycisphaerae bacterium]
MRTVALTSSLLVVLLMILAVQAGCTLTQTQSEHAHLYDRDAYHDIYLIPDDIDTFWMLDRPTRLSRWLINY